MKSKVTEFGKELRKYRVMHDMSLAELSDVVSISISQLSAIERGKRNITIKNFKKLARAFKWSISERYELGIKADDSNTYKHYAMPF